MNVRCRRLFSLDTSNVKREVPWVIPFWSPLLILFYGAVLAAVLIVNFVLTPQQDRSEANAHPPEGAAPAEPKSSLHN